MKTTPGCQEVVDWTIFPMPVFISERQVNAIKMFNDVSKTIAQFNVIFKK